MRVPLLDLRPQFEALETELKHAVYEVLQSTRYIMGPKVEALEQAVANYTGVRHGIGVSSGTDALLVALMALDVGPGDLVVTTPYSFFATAGVIARLGARPVFADINAETFNLDPAALEAWFEAHEDEAHRVKAIIPVHLFGQCAEMDAVLEIGGRYGAAVIEDAAQAIGARYPSKSGERKAGAMGLMGCFSFFPSKNLGGIGDGGMVVTDDDDLAEKLRRLRNHGMHPKYHHAMIGGNFRLDAIQAAVLLVKLNYLDSWHAARQQNAAHYDAHITAAGVVKPAVAYGRERHIYNQYVLLAPDRRDALREFLDAHEVATEVYYPVPFHEQACFAGLGYGTGDFPNSERAARNSVALPIYPELSEAQLDHVAGQINAFYGA